MEQMRSWELLSWALAAGYREGEISTTMLLPCLWEEGVPRVG